MIHKRYFILLLTLNCISQAAELDFKSIKRCILETSTDDPNVSNSPESNQLSEAYRTLAPAITSLTKALELLTLNCIAQAAEAELDYSQLKPILLAALEDKPDNPPESNQLSEAHRTLAPAIISLTKALFDQSDMSDRHDVVSNTLDECIDRRKADEPVPITIYNQVLRKQYYMELRKKGTLKKILDICLGAAPCFKYRCLNEGDKCCTRCKMVNYCSRDCQRADWKAGHKQQCKQR